MLSASNLLIPDPRRIPRNEASAILVAEVVCLALWRSAKGRENATVPVSLEAFRDLVDGIGIAGVSVADVRTALGKVEASHWAIMATARPGVGNDDWGTWKTTDRTRQRAKRAADQLGTVLMPAALPTGGRDTGAAATPPFPIPATGPLAAEIKRLADSGVDLHRDPNDARQIIVSGLRKMTRDECAWLCRNDVDLLRVLPAQEVPSVGVMLGAIAMQVARPAAEIVPLLPPITETRIPPMPTTTTRSNGAAAPAVVDVGVPLPSAAPVAAAATHHKATPAQAAREARLSEGIALFMDILGEAESAGRERAGRLAAEAEVARQRSLRANDANDQDTIAEAAHFIEQFMLAMADASAVGRMFRAAIGEYFNEEDRAATAETLRKLQEMLAR